MNMNMNLLPNNNRRNIFNPMINPNNINNYYYTCINFPLSLGGNKTNTPLIINNLPHFNSFFHQNYFNLNYPIFCNNYNINKIGLKNDINKEKDNNLTPKINSLLNTNYKSPFNNNGNLIKNFNINDLENFQKNNLNDIKSQELFQTPINIKSNNKSNIIINESDEITSNSEFILSTVNNSSKKDIFKFNKNEKNTNTNNFFNVTLKKKRGRMCAYNIKTKKPKRTHMASDYDNILRKVQVHYLSFLVNFMNEILSNFYPDDKELRFQNLSYDIKKNVRHSYVEELKSKKLSEILPLKASSKFKKHDLNTINKIIYNKICIINPVLKDFCQMTCLEFFNEYYIKDKRKIELGGKEINFSEKTKFFNDLVKKNSNSADKMKQIIQTQFSYKNNSDLFIVNKVS